jgi:hypothetical protein
MTPRLCNINIESGQNSTLLDDDQNYTNNNNNSNSNTGAGAVVDPFEKEANENNFSMLADDDEDDDLLFDEQKNITSTLGLDDDEDEDIDQDIDDEDDVDEDDESLLEDDNEISLADCWIVIGQYFSEKGLVTQQVESFNEFINTTIQEIIDDTRTMTAWGDPETDKDSDEEWVE